MFVLQQHVDALLLALASSTDNFTVGLSMGMTTTTTTKTTTNDGRQHLDSEKRHDKGDDQKTKRRRRQQQQQQQQDPRVGLSFVWVNFLISTSNALGAWIATSGAAHALTTTMLLVGAGRDDNNTTTTTDLSTTIVPVLAALAFASLAMQDWMDWYRRRRPSCLPPQRPLRPALSQSTRVSSSSSSSLPHDDNDDDDGDDNAQTTTTTTTRTMLPQVMRLALPMTLNNLAGGVAGGAAGVSPSLAAVHALVASFGTMAVGHWMGQKVSSSSSSSLSRPNTRDHDDDEKKKKKSFWARNNGLADPSFLSGCLFGLLSLLTLWEALA